MADRLATPLGTESEVLVFEELLVAQDDIRSIGKSVDTHLMELDQQVQQPVVHDEHTRQGAQSSILNVRPTTALPNKVSKHLNPITVTHDGVWGIFFGEAQ